MNVVTKFHNCVVIEWSYKIDHLCLGISHQMISLGTFIIKAWEHWQGHWEISYKTNEYNCSTFLANNNHRPKRNNKSAVVNILNAIRLQWSIMCSLICVMDNIKSIKTILSYSCMEFKNKTIYASYQSKDISPESNETQRQYKKNKKW